jgi:hypothetical protein
MRATTVHQLRAVNPNVFLTSSDSSVTCVPGYSLSVLFQKRLC